MKKKVLLDLSALHDLYQGRGQIAMNYGNHFKETYNSKTSPFEITLLVPKSFFGHFGNEVKYLSSTNWFRRHSRYLFPKFDIWHNLQHWTRFKPYFQSTKYIYTIHDLHCLILDYEGSSARVDRNYRRMKRHIERADVVVGISFFTKQQIYSFFDMKDKPYQTIYNGVENIVENTAKKPDCYIQEPFFFYISAFREKKNFHLLLDMMRLMPEKQLYLAGNYNTEYGQKILHRIEDEKIDNVKLLGTVSEEEKVWLYKNCEAFLFPSSFEGFGLPIIEAMQFGKPVFSSKETSLKEIGSSYAYFWDSFAPEDMKRLIDSNLEMFYNSPQLAEEEKKYAASFSYKKHFEEYNRLYLNL